MIDNSLAALSHPAVKDLMRRANAELLAAHGRSEEIEARFADLQDQVLALANAAAAEVAAAEARARAAEERLAAVLELLGLEHRMTALAA